jgi:hypothetical protein
MLKDDAGFSGSEKIGTYRRKMCECEVVDVDAGVLCCSWRKLVVL